MINRIQSGWKKGIFRLLGIGLGISFGVSGCPDTTIPQLGSSRQSRVCSLDEVQAFRDLSIDNERTDLWIAFVDVGQGDSIWIRTPGTRDLDAKDILVDSGNCLMSNGGCGLNPISVDSYDSDGITSLLDFMKDMGWTSGNQIDYLVATHPDKDHYGGTWQILQNYRVGAFIAPGVGSENSTYQKAIESVVLEQNLINLTPVSDKGLNRSQMGENQTESWGRNVEVSLLSARKDASADNDASVVLMINFQNTRILLTGDSEERLDTDLIALDDAALQQGRPSILRADVLKAGHHGGQGTSTQNFLDRVFPENQQRRYAVISAGRRDNLPAPETVERLQDKVGDFGLYRTDRNDEMKDRSSSPGDDHILLKVSSEGDLTVCYAERDAFSSP
jgi:competence protein ComEC